MVVYISIKSGCISVQSPTPPLRAPKPATGAPPQLTAATIGPKQTSLLPPLHCCGFLGISVYIPE
ncbi:hypothetical protein E2C01_074143 [Portunus trituberculatus]|uniref:Uncharacterized protein n=1 Tax=Portunus trituberculatus TaxID=210409 RepID=A0A5B7IDK4_PORTR|nr:hypothetical protein [Portunus trituberculatus]